MKVTQIAALVLALLFISLAESAKTIKSQHSERRLRQKKDRKLYGSLMGGDTETEDMEEESEHSHMTMMMQMMEKNTQISNIMKNVKRFSSSLDDLAESVNTQIVNLASVANANLNKNLYLNKI